MKNLSQPVASKNAGFSTLELLIAFAILTLSLTAVIMVAFGNQSAAVDTELSQRALYLAEQKLEEASAGAHQSGFSTLADTTAVSGQFTTATTFSDDECFKIVTSEVAWERGLRRLQTVLTTLVSSPEESAALGGDCAAAPLGDDWDNPSSLDITDVIGSGDSGTDVDVLEHEEGIFAFLTSAQGANKGEVWVINITDIDNVDSDSVEAVFNSGANNIAIDSYVAASGDIYSFVASASSTAELHVLRTTFPPAYPTQPPTITLLQKFNLPAKATEVQYRNGKVFVSTMGSNSNEFFTYDETSPGVLTADQTVDLGNNVDALDFAVGGAWAYLATAHNAREVTAFDFESPATERYYDAPGNANATAIYASGQYTYLGRERDASEADFFILRNSDILSGTSDTDGLVDSVDMDEPLCTRITGSTLTTNSCLKAGKKVVGIAVLGRFAFLSTDETDAEFQVWDISAKNDIRPHIGCNAYEFPANPSAIEFPGPLPYTGYPQGRELGFVAVNSNDALRVIYDPSGPGICLP